MHEIITVRSINDREVVILKQTRPGMTWLTVYAKISPTSPLWEKGRDFEDQRLLGMKASTPEMEPQRLSVELMLGVILDQLSPTIQATFQVHGGVSYMGRSYWDAQPSGWWLGLDLNHLGDQETGRSNDLELALKEAEILVDQIKMAEALLVGPSNVGSPKSQESAS